MRASILAAFTVLACSPQGPALAPVQAAAPELLSMDLEVQGEWGHFTRHGDTLTFELDEAPPGARVRVYYSDAPHGRGASWCPAPLGGWCLDLQREPERSQAGFFTLPRVVDAEGRVSWTTVLPTGVAADRDYRFQAVAMAGPRVARSDVSGLYLEAGKGCLGVLEEPGSDDARTAPMVSTPLSVDDQRVCAEDTIEWYPMDLDAGEIIDAVVQYDGPGFVGMYVHALPVDNRDVSLEPLAWADSRRDGEETLHFEQGPINGRVWLAVRLVSGLASDFLFEVNSVVD